MKEIYLDYISEDQQEIIRLIGLENFLKLCEYFAGEKIYFPKMFSMKIEERNRKIVQEFNGKNINILSKKYNICDRQIRRIIKKSKS